MKRFPSAFADDRCKMTIIIQISRLVYGEFHRRPAKNIKHTQRMRSQDNSSGEQVFATFTKLFLNVTSTVGNPKLLDLCPSFFFLETAFPASLRRADPAPDFFSRPFFSRSLRIKSDKRWHEWRTLALSTV